MKIRDEISIVLCGEAGQGIQTIENLLPRILKLSGFNVFATKEYMSRVRGGINSSSIRVASYPVRAYVERVDILVNLGKELTRHLEKRISPKTIILSDLQAGPASNIVAIGALAALFKLEKEKVRDMAAAYFAKKGKEVIEQNIGAVEKGYAIGAGLKIELEIKRGAETANDIIASGAEALALGAIAGGCNFISAYPMTPSTGIFTYLSQHAKEFGIISEQAEDEISAVNMAIGAWYAGARALVNTSGGGFDLMQEGISLAGMLESPLVINLGQRPGPATGLPTRTEQSDLNLALYSGHGEFPRIILAPGSIEEAFYLAQKAFNLADKYQVPVFILSDQYLVDSYYNLPAFDLSKVKVEKAIAKTSLDYKRYLFTKNGISPRGIPGYGDGLVALDSDEHDEEGHITEELVEVRPKMVEKRMRKLKALKNDEVRPEIFGDKKYRTLVVGWGSNRDIIKEAVERSGKKGLAFAHFQQLFPLPSNTGKILSKAKNIIFIENNFSGQFSNLIKLHAGISGKHKVLHYDGLPFSVEAVMRYIKKYA